ncbi:MAG: hypothetical protein QM668_09005 [Agriterribacter sp.]
MTKNNNLLQETPVSLENIGENIGFEKGAKMVKDYYDLHGETHCHFVGKSILEKLLNQPECVGITIYKALNDKGVDTYVFIGVDSNGKAILDYTAVNYQGDLKKEYGIVANRFSKREQWFTWSF